MTMYCGDNCNHTGPHHYPLAEKYVGLCGQDHTALQRQAVERALDELDQLFRDMKPHLGPAAIVGFENARARFLKLVEVVRP